MGGNYYALCVPLCASSHPLSPLSLFQGFMEYSYLFYGYYNNTVAESSGFSYNLPLAYLLTAVFYFAFCLICVILRSVPHAEQFHLALDVEIKNMNCASLTQGAIVLTGYCIPHSDWSLTAWGAQLV